MFCKDLVSACRGRAGGEGLALPQQLWGCGHLETFIVTWGVNGVSQSVGETEGREL